jgi:transketolase
MGRSKLDIILKENGDIFYGKDYEYEYGKADTLREGDKGCLFVTGTLTNNAIKAVDKLKKDNINIRLINISSPLSIPSETIVSSAKTGVIFTLEDHNVKTGLGAIIAQKMIDVQAVCPLVKFGVENYACSGTADDVYRFMGLDVDSVVQRIKKALSV